MIILIKFLILTIAATSYGENIGSFTLKGYAIKKDFSEKNINEHINYPGLIRDYSLSGISVVEFNVDKHGNIKNVEILKSLGQPFDVAILNGLQSFTSQEMLESQFSKGFRYRLPIYFKN